MAIYSPGDTLTVDTWQSSEGFYTENGRASIDLGTLEYVYVYESGATLYVGDGDENPLTGWTVSKSGGWDDEDLELTITTPSDLQGVVDYRYQGVVSRGDTFLYQGKVDFKFDTVSEPHLNRHGAALGIDGMVHWATVQSTGVQLYRVPTPATKEPLAFIEDLFAPCLCFRDTSEVLLLGCKAPTTYSDIDLVAYRSLDGCKTFTQIGGLSDAMRGAAVVGDAPPGLSFASRSVDTLYPGNVAFMAPSFYLAERFFSVASPPEVWVSFDVGLNWQSVTDIYSPIHQMTPRGLQNYKTNLGHRYRVRSTTTPIYERSYNGSGYESMTTPFSVTNLFLRLGTSLPPYLIYDELRHRLFATDGYNKLSFSQQSGRNWTAL